MEYRLNPKQKKFCKLYASEVEFFGNGVESYVEAYNVDKTKPNWYKTAAVCAARLLRKANVLKEINSLLEENDLNDGFVDKQLRFLITQNADLKTKLGAIGEYNKLKARIIKKIEAKVETPTPIYGSKSKV